MNWYKGELSHHFVPWVWWWFSGTLKQIRTFQRDFQLVIHKSYRTSWYYWFPKEDLETETVDKIIGNCFSLCLTLFLRWLSWEHCPLGVFRLPKVLRFSLNFPKVILESLQCPVTHLYLFEQNYVFILRDKVFIKHVTFTDIFDSFSLTRIITISLY